MPRYSASHTPQYRLHRSSGQALVTLAGKVHYLGKFSDSPDSESRQKYNRLLAEWFAAGRQPTAMAANAAAAGAAVLSVEQLIATFWVHAQRYYCDRDGKPTSELKNLRYDLRILRRLFGKTPATEFGPRSLKAIQSEMVRTGVTRRSINRRINRIRHVFTWGVAEELIPPALVHGLKCVKGLKKGRTDAIEADEVKAVSEAVARATIAAAGRVLATMIELQLLTGMRSGELIIMRTADVDRSGTVWTYAPSRHKTEHHGHARTVFLGARAQQILTPMLKLETRAYVFSPAEAEAERRAALAAGRKTPLSCGNRAGTNRSRSPKRTPGERYTVTSYCRAVQTACAKAFPVPAEMTSPDEVRAWSKAHRFHPHQLRHTAGTRFGRDGGAETARVLLGHRDIKTTQIYAEIDDARAREFILKIG